MALNQHFLFSETNLDKFMSNMKIAYFCSNGAENFDGYRLWFKFEDLGMEPGDEVKVFYGSYDENYVHPATRKYYWECIQAEAAFANSSTGYDFYVDIPENATHIPLLFAAGNSNGSVPGDGGTIPQPSNPGSPSGGGSAGIPETGDSFIPMLWLGMMFVAAGMMILRKRKYN